MTATNNAACEVEANDTRAVTRGDAPQELLERPDGYAPTGNAMIDVMLMCEHAIAARRKLADKSRAIAEASQRSAEDQQVEKMREEARATFARALTSCAFSMAASGAQVASGALQVRAGGLQCDAARYKPGATEAQWFTGQSARAGGFARVWDGVGTSINGVGSAATGALDMGIKNDQAEAKALEHAAARAGRAASAAADASREAKDIAEKTMHRLDQLVEMEQQTKLALIQRM